jgi:integration host factor subunit beta
MIKSELIKRIAAQNPHLFERDIEKIVSVIFDEMVKALRRGDRVELRGFGAFSVKLREARTGRNPRTDVVVSVRKESLSCLQDGEGNARAA